MYSFRLATLTTLLAIGTGCVELAVDLSVAKSGSAKMHTEFAISDKALGFMEGLGQSMNDNLGDGSEAKGIDELKEALKGGTKEQVARAKAEGLTLKSRMRDEGFGVVVDSKAKSVRALDWQSVAMGVKDEPTPTGPTFVQNDDGTVTLTMKGGSSLLDGDPGKGAGTAPTDMMGMLGGGGGDGEPAVDPDEMMAMVNGMMGMIGADFSIRTSITVPGTIVSATPSTALNVDGSTATWDFGLQDLMEMGGAPEPMNIVFKPKGKLSGKLFE